MADIIRVDNPATGELVFEVPLLGADEIATALDRAQSAHCVWRDVSIDERISAVERFIDAFAARTDEVARDITLQMGKPLAQSMGEVSAMLDRARHMASIASECLATETLPAKSGLVRTITREPVGIVFDIPAWNYPLLVAVNAVVPAMLAGNAVLIKHSKRTPRCAQHFADAFEGAGVPDGLVQATPVSHANAARILADPRVGAVSFVGSTRGGRAVYQEAAKSRFIDVGLELGGKDPAYVCDDADLDFAIANVIEGAFYNAGQSCCAVERVYVAAPHFDAFVEGALNAVGQYRIGDPLEPDTTLGPMALPSAPAELQAQVDDATARGARILTGGTAVVGPGRYFQPTLLIDVSHDMALMTEESFGPIVGIMKVRDDDEAIALMNDSPYGLTASVWTADLERAQRIGSQLATGTVFMNRCDFLDPALPWTGVKDSGKGATLSHHGFDAFTRLKSYHLRLSTTG